MHNRPAGPCPLCAGQDWQAVFNYTAPPAGEVRFPLAPGETYARAVWRCGVCGHYVSRAAMDLSRLYHQDYVDATYGAQGLRAAFDRITALDPARSDNAGRVRRILEYTAAQLRRPAGEGRPPAVLDVGSGLCVFLHRMQAAGWAGTAIDPDQRAAAHARDVVGVAALCGDFLRVDAPGRYDLVTFNKVLEHVPDPAAMLARAAVSLHPDGLVYVEVPDGEAAQAAGPEREEFFIEHLHVFSAVSLALLTVRAGFQLAELERLRDPSGKYTLRAFMRPARPAPTGS